MALPTWIDTTIHTTTEPEVYSDLEGNVKMSWPIPELGESSRHTVAVPADKAKGLADRILEQVALVVARD